MLFVFLLAHVRSEISIGHPPLPPPSAADITRSYVDRALQRRRWSGSPAILPPNASMITFDAVSMYTNINIDNCIERISTFLADIWDKHDCKAVTTAMEIVMKNNRMRFGDLIYHQI